MQIALKYVQLYIQCRVMKQARCTKYRMFFMGHAFAITTSPFSRDPSDCTLFLPFSSVQEVIREGRQFRIQRRSKSRYEQARGSAHIMNDSDTTAPDIILTNKIFAFRYMNPNRIGKEKIKRNFPSQINRIRGMDLRMFRTV